MGRLSLGNQLRQDLKYLQFIPQFLDAVRLPVSKLAAIKKQAMVYSACVYSARLPPYWGQLELQARPPGRVCQELPICKRRCACRRHSTECQVHLPARTVHGPCHVAGSMP